MPGTTPTPTVHVMIDGVEFRPITASSPVDVSVLGYSEAAGMIERGDIVSSEVIAQASVYMALAYDAEILAGVRDALREAGIEFDPEMVGDAREAMAHAVHEAGVAAFEAGRDEGARDVRAAFARALGTTGGA